ncbi:hypothetical protein XBI1_1710002 [Xenorhabdus bovienii str. Intermedium]|uniref:Uncharacterized protein n=1 Tax=Xenorhabdus bovienii str. Intermedium TaxID=1379677 RepID=A0A077Q6Q6_XENBV|nr:hypothetical protein XBI1_1710002 [Xenorhabdus bovienii str. Intermedium]
MRKISHTLTREYKTKVGIPFETEACLHHAGDTIYQWVKLKGIIVPFKLIVLSVGYGFY